MTLEAAYWVALGVGVGFLLLSIVLGDVFDFLDFLDLDIGDGVSATPVFFTATAAFGAGGLLGLKAFDLSRGMSLIAGLGTSVVLGAAATGFFALLRKQEAGEGFMVSQLVGELGQCTLSITPGKSGRVAIHYGGMTRTLSAVSDEEIRAGEEVIVLGIVGNTLKVGRKTAEVTASD